MTISKEVMLAILEINIYEQPEGTSQIGDAYVQAVTLPNDHTRP